MAKACGRCVCCKATEERSTTLENLAFEARKEYRNRITALLIRDHLYDDIIDECQAMRKVLLELAHINDPETKELIARRALGLENE